MCDHLRSLGLLSRYPIFQTSKHCVCWTYVIVNGWRTTTLDVLEVCFS
uniref:Uncharacterized protein n=1 Tax=Arundo donax TaxID=35708 RepID=A0A0A8ZQP9_ARUDO